MRILHINDYAFPLGGAETYLAALMSEQRRYGHEAALLASDSRGGGTLELCKTSTRQFDKAAFLATGTSSSFKPRRAMLQLYNASAYSKAKNVLLEFRPNIVHVHMYLGQLSPSVLIPFIEKNIPLIHTSHTYRIACPKGDRVLKNSTFCEFHTGLPCIKNCSAISYAHMRLREHVYQKPQDIFRVVIAPGSTMARILKLEGFPRVVQLPYGSTFDQRNFQESRHKRKNILYVGRLSTNKGVEILIRAFAKVQKQLPDAKLIVAGDGPARQNLQNLAKKLLENNSYKFHGMISSDSIKKLQDQARIQCVPSVWPDNSPLVIYEALSAGIPLVASNIGGIPDLIRSGVEGILVPPRDVVEITAAILELFRSEEIFMGYSKAAYLRSQQYDMARHMLLIEDIYQEKNMLSKG